MAPLHSRLLPSASKPWPEKTSEEKYNTMGSWFLGPRGENADILAHALASIAEEVKEGRQKFWPQDPPSITAEMSSSEEFQASIEGLQAGLRSLASRLADSSVPFFSARYAGHMNGDISMPAVLGYVLAQQYNQNNAAPEGGPLTSWIEWLVGQQLCQAIGYDVALESSGEDSEIVGWGHMPADGSLANLESMWIARNLKYYPLSLHLAMRPGAPLDFVAPTFVVNLCTGKTKNFYSCSTWELLNLTPTEVADIPERLFRHIGISSDALSNILEPFSVQTVGKAFLDVKFGITLPMQYCVSRANHYSWPKGCAITGIGRDNLITVDVTYNARMNTTVLEELLNERLGREQAVYCVVAIMGTTEHGAVDPLEDILSIRRRMEEKGMSFMVHADAAWGGYFATKKTSILVPTMPAIPEYAFSIPLNKWTNTQMNHLHLADSVTLDPHKSGFVPYPAGGLCLRDGRHRYLTTWTSPYINASAGSDIAVGIYGIEGSKPGAAPVAVLVSHETIGLLSGGYADLLGTAMLTGVKMYGLWATMSLRSERLLVTPFNLLPIENDYYPLPAPPEKIREQQDEIWTKVVDRRNDELEHDTDALKLVHKMCPDTIINAFACNFKIGNVVNTDVVEANFLNTRLYQRLSVSALTDDLSDKPLLILRTDLQQAAYKDALTMFKRRIGLSGPEDLVALSNVSMSPFPTAGQFLTEVILPAFQATAEEEIINCLVRTQKKPSIHGFVIHGSGPLYLAYLPMFHITNHKQQVIVTGELSPDAVRAYLELQRQYRDSVFTIHTVSGVLGDLKTLDQILKDGSFVGDIYRGLPSIYGSSLALKGVKFTITGTRTNNPLGVPSAQPSPYMPFTLFGSSSTGYHIEHALRTSPNVQLSASGVSLSVSPVLSDAKKYTVTLDNKVEAIMLPITRQPLFFQPNEKLSVTVWEGSVRVAQGDLTLPASAGSIFFDCDFLNEEIAADVYVAVPAGSTAPDYVAQQDIDKIAGELVARFRSKDITWTDNVPHAIRRKYPVAKNYSVTLGIPEEGTVKPGSYFAVVSRFVSSLPTNKKPRMLARYQACIDTFGAGY